MPTKQGAFLLVSIFHRHSADLRSAARLHGTGLRVDSRSVCGHIRTRRVANT